jgi:hypothetical protein
LNQPRAAPGVIDRAESSENVKGEQPVAEGAVGNSPTFDDLEVARTVANVASDRVGLAGRLELALVEWRRSGDVRALRRALLAALSELDGD